jgi:PAS domain S-box-containing protein
MEQELTTSTTWTLLDNLDEGVLVVGKNGAVNYINQAAINLMGFSTSINPKKKTAQYLSGTNIWHNLLSPPHETILHTPMGKAVRLVSKRSNILGNEVVQILVNHYGFPSQDKEASVVVDQLSALTQISSEPNYDKKLQFIVDGLQKLGWQRVGLSLRNKDFTPTKIITAGFSEEEKKHIFENILPASTWLELFHEESLQQFRHGSCYFVPGDSEWSQKWLGQILLDDKATGKDPDSWHPKDIFCAVLFDRQNTKIGLLGLDRPQNGMRPSPISIQTIELYAQFASSILENAQLVDETLAQSREFEILFEASHALSSTLDKDAILKILGKHMLQAVHADGYTFLQWHETKNELAVLKDYGRFAKPNQLRKTGDTFKVNHDDPLKTILIHQQPIVNHVFKDDTFVNLTPAWWQGETPYTSAILPLTLSGNIFGLIQIVKCSNGHKFGDRELQLLAALSNQASSALETALVFEDTYEREQFYNALGNVTMAINSTLDSQIVLQMICSEGVRIFQVDGAYIWQLDDAHFVGSAATGHGADDFQMSRVSLTETAAFVSHLAEKGQAIYLNHVQNNPDIKIKLPDAKRVQAVLGVPLEQDGKLIGLLILVDTHNPKRFSDKDLSWATLFGVQAAIALKNANLFVELRRFNEELDLRVADRTRALNEESNRVKILLRVTTELSASLDQDRVLNKALSLVNEVVNATQGVILLINPEQKELIFRAALGDGAHTVSPKGEPSGLNKDEGLAGWMIDNRSAVIVHDTNNDPRWIELPSSTTHRSVLGVPLITNEEVIGVMMLFHSEPEAFTMQQLDLVEAAAIQVANAINNASLYKLISEQADQLGSMLRSEIIQKANLKAILESIADGVIVADSRNTIDLVNVPASTFLGIPREQLMGKSIREMLGLYGHFEGSWLERIDYWSRNADKLEHGTFLADQLMIEDKVLSVHLSPVLSDQQYYGTVSIFRDITKEVEVDKLKSEFVSTVSHELRTPMTSIKGYADLMLMGAAGEMAEGQVRYLSVIKNNADRLHMLVNDLLNISRIETGKTQLDLRPLDITLVIDQIVESHLNGRIQHENKELSININTETSLPLVNADKARVTQIMTNLLDNAFNYTPNNGQISIGATATPSYVFITVEDNGIGIAPENLAKIFDRFYRAEDEKVQQVPGTGLGLAIVQSLIEMHGGDLIVESELGTGSKFTFNLPVVVEDGDPTSVTLA